MRRDYAPAAGFGGASASRASSPALQRLSSSRARMSCAFTQPLKATSKNRRITAEEVDQEGKKRKRATKQGEIHLLEPEVCSRFREQGIVIPLLAALLWNA